MAPKAKVAKKSGVGTTTKLPSQESNKAQQQRPNWPAIKTVLTASDLTFETLLEDQILTIPQLWTSSLCKNYISFLSTLPLTTTPGKPKKGEAVRVNDRYQIDDAAFANELWSQTALRELISNPVMNGTALSEVSKRELWGGEVLGLNSNIRIYRYSEGQFFDKHYDDSNNVMFPSASAPSPVPARTTWTLLLYLSSPATGCQGGETVFYPEAVKKREAAPPPVVADLEVGTALLHRHGNECLLHEGREVTKGEKWVIRSDLCVRR